MKVVTLSSVVFLLGLVECRDSPEKALEDIKEKLDVLSESIDDKMGQLQALKQEIRDLNRDLKRHQVGVMPHPQQHQQDHQQQEPQQLHLNTTSARPADRSSASSESRAHKKAWRKRVRSRIRGMQRKIHKLEQAFKDQKRAVRVMHRMEKKRFRTEATPNKVELRFVTSTASIIDNFEAQRNKSRPGEHDTPCGSHNECKPGHCCHRKTLNAEAKCVKHVFRAGDACQDSCACENHLHCFREKSRPDRPYCKEAKAEDFQLGTYANARNQLFTDG